MKKNLLLIGISLIFSVQLAFSQTAASYTEYIDNGMPVPIPNPPQNTTSGFIMAESFFTDSATFVNACAALSHEDFNTASVPPFGVTVCNDPINATTSGACFGVGQLLPGFSLASSSGSGIVALGTGFFPNQNSPAVGPNSFADIAILTFSPPVKAVGFKLWSSVGANANITITHAGGVVNTSASTGGAFWGVVSDDPISMIEIEDPAGGGEIIDDLFFGNCGAAGPAVIPTMSQWATFLYGLVVFTIFVVGFYNYKKGRIKTLKG